MERGSSYELFLRIRGEAAWACTRDESPTGAIIVEGTEYAGRTPWSLPALGDMLYSRSTREFVGVLCGLAEGWDRAIRRQLPEIDTRVFRFHYGNVTARENMYYSRWRSGSIAFLWQNRPDGDIELLLWQELALWWQSPTDWQLSDPYRLPSIISITLEQDFLDLEHIELPKEMHVRQMDVRFLNHD